MMSKYLKENNAKVKDGADVNSIMRDMISIILESALYQEMDEELGYFRYDYRNKEAVIPRRLCIPAIAVLISQETIKVGSNHRSSKNIRIWLLRTWNKRSFTCMPRQWPQGISETIYANFIISKFLTLPSVGLRIRSFLLQKNSKKDLWKEFIRLFLRMLSIAMYATKAGL